MQNTQLIIYYNLKNKQKKIQSNDGKEIEQHISQQTKLVKGSEFIT